MLWRHRGLREVLIFKMSKEINFYLNAVFIIDSVSKQLSFCFQDSSFPLSCLIEMPGYQIKKRRIINAKKFIFFGNLSIRRLPFILFNF